VDFYIHFPRVYCTDAGKFTCYFVGANDMFLFPCGTYNMGTIQKSSFSFINALLLILIYNGNLKNLNNSMDGTHSALFTQVKWSQWLSNQLFTPACRSAFDEISF
jgi:hypothetical protein